VTFVQANLTLDTFSLISNESIYVHESGKVCVVFVQVN